MSKVAEKVVQLHKDLYLVDSDLLEYAGASFETDEQVFINPRHAGRANAGMGKGFEKDAMASLREGIRTEGLLHPLIVCSGSNIGSQKMTIVNGERRKRCIDKLKADNTPCLNRDTGKFEPASEIYASIPCIVLVNPDVETLYKYAWSSNEGAESIGEAAQVALIRQWRKWNWTDEKICDITDKSITWLKETDQILGLDDDCWERFQNQEINRAVALKVANIVDIPKRIAAVDTACAMAAKRLNILTEEIQADLAEAKEQAELEKAKVVDAEMQNNEKKKAKAKENVAKLEKKVAKKKDEKDKLKNSKAKASVKDLNAANEELDNVAKRLTFAKIEKCWIAPCVDAVKSDGKDDKGEDLGIDVEDARLVVQLWNNIESGEREIFKILKAHSKARLQRAEKK